MSQVSDPAPLAGLPAGLRAARDADAPALAAILGGWVRQTPWMPKLHNAAEDLGFLQHLIENQDVTVTGDPPRGFLARDGEEISALYLAPAARGQGLGRALLEAAKAASPRLALWTFAANTGARSFYAREGFVETGRTEGENEEGLPDIRMEWRAADHRLHATKGAARPESSSALAGAPGREDGP